MSEKVKLKERIKGFYILHHSWLARYFNIIFLSIILGLICGFVMVLFNYLLILFKMTFSYLPYFISPILAGLLTSLLVKYGNANRIMGTGAAEFVEDVNRADLNLEQSEMEFNRKQNVFSKTLATSWTYGSGMICGLEGPGLLIGGNLGYLFFKTGKYHLEGIDAFFIGASACTGAILKAPISGALFCAELPYFNHIRYKSLVPSIIASTIAYFIYCTFFEFTPLVETDLSSISPERVNYLLLLPLLVLFGIISGLFVLVFMSLLREFTSKVKKFFERKNKLWLSPLCGALAYALFLFMIIPFLIEDYESALIGPDASFLNYFINTINLIKMNWIFYLILGGLFLIGIFLSIGTMNSAGIIMPLMIFGAILGAVFGKLFYPENPQLFVLLGISAVLGASLNTPIAAIFLLLELTWAPFLLIPASITTLIAYIFSGPTSIIRGQKNI
ncbi:MAG: chloride channel protein [Promethearchaeota archaeon]|nr:MAG: chloride channel protein [Candidatus Lokiarchaeota archaeon]